MSNIRRVCWVALKLAAGTGVLWVLALPAMLRAQSSECQIPGLRQHADELKRRKNGPPNVPDLGVGAPATDTEERTGGVGDAYTRTSSPNPLSTDVGPCLAIGDCANSTSASARFAPSLGFPSEPIVDGDNPRDGSKPVSAVVRSSNRPDLSHSTYYKNRIEFSLDGGWLPINIPFVFDVFLGDGYTRTPLNYTLVPIIASLRWQVDDVGGPWIFRGNWDIEASAAVTLIPRGPESRYIAWIMGFRRNFVPRRGRIAPYFDGRLGLGNIDAKEPAGVLFAQGQDFTFTMNMGSGIRYNFNPRYSISAGLNWMHISNLYLSEPKFANYGINVYGPMFGVNVFLGRLGHHRSE